MTRVTTISGGHTAKEDRDYLLDYKSIDLHSLVRVPLLDVPVDNVDRDEAVALIMELLERKSGVQHVLFLDPIKLMRVRPRRKLESLPAAARLVLADGAGLEWCARKLGTPLKERIPMIALLMDVIRLAEKKALTIYFLGSKPEYLERVFFNMQRSFPGVRIIGRQSGHFAEGREQLVKESLRKSAPNIVFIGMGFPAQEQWIYENQGVLGNAVVFGIDGALDVLSGLEKKAPDFFQVRGLAWLWRGFSRPWRISRWFYFWHFALLTIWRSLRRSR